MISEIRKFFKYSLVGTSGTILDLLAIYIFVEFLYLNVILAAILAFIVAATNNFVLNKIWTFNNKSKEYRHQYLKFIIVSVIGLTITIFLMYIFNTILGIWYLIAKLMTSGIVLFWNFLGNRLWTFKPDQPVIEKLDEFKYEYSIVIPAFNEENRILKTLSIIKKYVDSKIPNSEIIIVNDGSSDKTEELINNELSKISNLKIVNLKKNRGKGYAVRKGIEKSLGKYILITDADNATSIEELSNFKQHLDNYDILIGSRKVKGSQIIVKGSIPRRIISWFSSRLTLTLVKNIKDTQCGFKLMKNNVARHIFSKQKTFKYGFDIEMLAIAQHYDYTIIEIPVRWIHDNESKVRPVKDTIKTFKEFLGIHYNFITKRY
jgi:dolichyl-phosphate beta-glucosyltransferase